MDIVVGGNFSIEKKIGEGAFGQVFKGKQRILTLQAKT
jgi:serine/threonine protein kinase